MTIDNIAERASLTLALGAAVALATGCGPSSGAGAAAAAQDTAFVKVVNVEVRPVERIDFTSYIRITGEVEALNDVTVSAEESGVIDEFLREKGDFVLKGDPLARIDDRVLRAQVEEAEAQANLAAERFERQRRLWEDEGIGSEMTFLEAKYEAELAAARLASLNARLDRTVIAAPVSGVFDERYVEAGEMVSPGVRVVRIVQVNRVKVTGGVPERFAGSVARGDTARIDFDLFPNRRFEGTIGFVGTTVDPQSRTFRIEVVMENPGRLIKPQMIANVQIADRRLDDAIVVPQASVIRTETGYQVYVAVDQNGTLLAEPRDVVLGPTHNNRTVIEEGLRAGERLIVRGQKMVDPGDRVRIVSAVAE
jgi:RND family efflux transporter MFP subunit